MWFSSFTSTLDDGPLFLFMVGGIVGLSILALILVRSSRRWKSHEVVSEKEEEANKSAFDYIGVMYAVLLGLMIVNTQTKFSQADMIATNEAAAIQAAARDTSGLPEPLRSEVQNQIATYTRMVIDEDWPFMGTGHQTSPKPLQSSAELNKLWTLYGKQITEAPLGDNLMSDFNAMSLQRTQRFAIVREGVPDTLWLLLAVGTFVMIYLVILRHGQNFNQHLRTLVFVCVPLAIFLWLIAQLDNPFAGTIHVGTTAYEKALQVLQAIQGAK